MKYIGRWGILAVLGLVIVGGLIGYVWLPEVQYRESLFSAWCSALGVPKRWAVAQEDPAARVSSEVVLNHQLLRPAQEADVSHGATLAERCTMCHTPTGVNGTGAPNLAGQYPSVIYKELRDFKSGKRSSPIMSAMASPLSDTDMQQLADYYASLHRPDAAPLASTPPPIVEWGAPMRNIPPCGSCHGDIDHTMASPWLEGESEGYLRTQLTAFAADTRHNDINGQMRAVASEMSSDEIAQAAAYFSGKSR